MILPAVLIHRFLGPNKAGLIFTTIIALHKTDDLNNLNQISFPTEIVGSTDHTTILAKNLRDKSKGRTLPINNRKNKKKFDERFHRKLEQHFPDWQGRIDFQRKQEKFYKSAMKRQAALRGTKMMDIRTRYTKEELDAIAYFQGTSFYQKQRNPKTKPNIFDTRQSFLLKVHDDQMKNAFLNSFNYL